MKDVGRRSRNQPRRFHVFLRLFMVDIRQMFDDSLFQLLTVRMWIFEKLSMLAALIGKCIQQVTGIQPCAIEAFLVMV
jgi:hypothetical protein